MYNSVDGRKAYARKVIDLVHFQFFKQFFDLLVFFFKLISKFFGARENPSTFNELLEHFQMCKKYINVINILLK